MDFYGYFNPEQTHFGHQKSGNSSAPGITIAMIDAYDKNLTILPISSILSVEAK
jgi:hypothetical protein